MGILDIDSWNTYIEILFKIPKSEKGIEVIELFTHGRSKNTVKKLLKIPADPFVGVERVRTAYTCILAQSKDGQAPSIL